MCEWQDRRVHIAASAIPYLVDVGQVMMGLMEELPQGVPTYRLHSEIAEAMPHAVGGE